MIHHVSYLDFDSDEPFNTEHGTITAAEGDNWWRSGNPTLSVVPEYFTNDTETVTVPGDPTYSTWEGLVWDAEGEYSAFDQVIHNGVIYTRTPHAGGQNPEPGGATGTNPIIGLFWHNEGPFVPQMIPGEDVEIQRPVQVPSENNVLRIEQGNADWQTIQTPSEFLEPGYTYLMTVAARLADGVEGTNQVAFVSGDNVWVPGNHGTQISANEWAWHTAEWTVTEDMGPQQVRIGTQNATNFLIDNVLITRTPISTDPGDGGNGGGSTQPPASSVCDLGDAVEVITCVDFTEGPETMDNWWPQWAGSGNPDMAVVEGPGGGYALEITRTRSWDGLQTAINLLEAGTEYTVLMDVRLAEGGPANAVATFNRAPGGWLGNASINSNIWTTIGGTFTAEDGVRLTTNFTPDNTEFTVYVRNLILTTPSEGGDNGNGGGETPPPAWNWDIMSHGGYTWSAEEGTWRLDRADWSGIFDTNDGENHFPMVEGSTYRFTAELKAANEAADGAQVNLAGYPGAHISNVNLDSDDYVTLEGELLAGPGGIDDNGNAFGQRFRVTSEVPGIELYVRNVTVTLVDDGGNGGAEVEWDEVAVLDFEDATINDYNQIVSGEDTWPTAGGSNWQLVNSVARTDNTWLSFAQTADWQGLQTPYGIIVNGVQYRITADVRWADGGSGAIRFVSSDNGDSDFSHIAPTNVSGTDWTTISGIFTTSGLTNPIVRLVGGAAGTIEVDNVRLEREAGAEVPEPFDPIVVWQTDFADGSLVNLEGAGATIGIIPVEGQGNVLNVTGRSSDDDQEWRGARIIDVIQPGVEYRVELTARLVGATAGAVQFRGMPGFGWISNNNITDEWTTVTSATWMAGASPAINLGLAPNGAQYQITEIKLWQMSPGFTVDPGWEFDGQVWDFDDNTTQDWFARSAAAPVTVVNGGAPVLISEETEDAPAVWEDTPHAIRVSNRSSQGDGPMINVVDILAPMQRFQISGWARFIDREAGNGQLTLSVQHGASNFTNLLQNIQVRNNEWTYFEGEFTMPAFTNTANLYFETPYMQGAAGDTSTFEIDQISIQPPGSLEWEEDLIPLSLTLPGINTGVAVDSRELSGEHAEMILHHFTKLVGENHMKPDFWFNGSGFNNFRMHPQAIEIMDFAVANNLDVFGHVLVWHSQTPS